MEIREIVGWMGVWGVLKGRKQVSNLNYFLTILLIVNSHLYLASLTLYVVSVGNGDKLAVFRTGGGIGD